MAEREILYRMRFEGSEEELKKLSKIREELDEIYVEKVKLDKNDKEGLERLKLEEQELTKRYRQEQGYLKDKNNALKTTANTLENLRAQARQYSKELEKIPIGTKAFNDMSAKMNQVNTQIRRLDTSAGNFRTNIGNYANSFGEAFTALGGNVSKVTGSLGAMAGATNPVGIGLAALVGGAQIFNGVIQTTNELADKFDIVMKQAESITSAFFKTIARGDWSNLINNMREAAEAGREYSQIMDDLGDRQRSLDIQESEIRVQILDLQKVLRNVNLTNEERIKAADTILELEDKITKKKKDNALVNLRAELEYSATLSKLNDEKLLDLIKNYELYEAQIDKVKELNQLEKDLSQATKVTVTPYGNTTGGKSAADVEALQNKIKLLREETKGYRKDIEAFALVSDKERESISNAAKEFYEADAGFREKTLRVDARRNALIKDITDAELKAIEDKAKAQEKADEKEKKRLEELLKLHKEYQKQLEDISLLLQKQYSLFLSGEEKTLPAMFGGKVLPDSLKPKARSGAKVNLGEETSPEVTNAFESANNFVDIWSNAYDEKERKLEDSLQKGLITEQQYQKEVEKLHKKQAALNASMAIAQLSADMARTLSALGVGAANTAKIGFPQNIPMLIAFAAQAAGIIANLRSIKFADGGIIGGNSHAMGGTKFVGSDGSAFEAEAGELITIVNKRDTARIAALSSINSVHGKPFYSTPSMSYFASGGVFSPATTTMDNSQLNRVLSRLEKMEVVLSLSKLSKAQARSVKIDGIGGM